MRQSLYITVISSFFILLSQAFATPQIIEMPTPGSGVVYFRTMVRAGSMHDPIGKEGLANFTALMLRRGTEKFSRQEIENNLDQIGGDIDFSVEKEFTIIAGRCLTSAIEPFYEIYRQVLTAANFPETEIAQAKNDQLAGIQLLKDDNTELGHEAFLHFLYRGTTWEHSAEGRVGAIKSFTRDDAVQFFKQHYVQPAIVVGVAGDYPTDCKRGCLQQKIRADLTSFPSAMFPIIPVPHPTLHGRRVLVVEKEGLDQGQINIGHPLDVTRKDADYPALYIAIKHLGDHRSFIGQLMHVIREDRGLTYGAYSYLEDFPYPYRSGADMLPRLNLARSQQDFRIWTFTLAKNMDFTIRLALMTLDDLMKGSLTKKRFQEIQEFSINKSVFQFETVERRLALALDDLIYGTDHFAKNFDHRLRQVTYAAVQKAITKHLHPDDLAIVVTVPNAKNFTQEFLSPGAEVEYQGQIDAKPLAKQDAVAKGLDLKVKLDQIEVMRASQLFE